MGEVCSDPISLAFYWLNPEHLSSHCEWALSSLAVPAAQISLTAYFRVFALTNLLEAPFYYWLLRRKNFVQFLSGLFVANALTHPLVYLGLPIVFSRLSFSYASFLSFAEGFAIIAEILFIRITFQTKQLPTVAMLTLANLFSWWAGVFLK